MATLHAKIVARGHVLSTDSTCSLVRAPMLDKLHIGRKWVFNFLTTVSSQHASADSGLKANCGTSAMKHEIRQTISMRKLIIYILLFQQQLQASNIMQQTATACQCQLCPILGHFYSDCSLTTELSTMSA